MKEEGHNYTFSIGEVPWHEQPIELGDPQVESKPYLEEVRQLLLHIMSNRYNPKDVWECASEALRLIDTEGDNG